VIIYIVLSGCTKESVEKIEKDISGQTEQKGPEITILNKPSIIEVITDLNIKITDDNNITTTIFVDGVEVISTTEKEFKLTIDPFDYKIGMASVSIISINELKKESNTDLSIEIKRLLFSDKSFFYKKNDTQGQRFISVHTGSGNLIELQKIDDSQDGNFYATEDFEKQNLIVTRYEIPGQFNSLSGVLSYTDVAIGTVVSSDQTPVYPDFFPKNGQLSLETENLTDLVAENYNSSLISDNPNNLASYRLIYSQDYNEKFFISTSSDIMNPIENYKYFVINSLTKTMYSNQDLKSPLRISTIDIPVDSDFRLNLYGFDDENAFSDQRFNEVYVSRVSTYGKVEIPIIEEFDVYQARLAYSYDRTDVLVNHKDIDSPIEPLKVDMIQNERNIEFIDTYDFLSFGFTNINQPNSVVWGFISKYKKEMTIPFYTFEIPQEIAFLLNANSLSLDISKASSQTSFLNCTLYKGHDHVYNSEQLIVEPNVSANRDGFVFKRTLDIL
tara:strand:- start:240 stop:1739 length:1500 start_codon:yes stop_codon:yes gene_type:complete